MSQILLIDNYDSFTFNLYHYLEEISNSRVTVMRNDEIDFEQVKFFDCCVISPGPGLPKTAGQLMEFLEAFSKTKKILGVCLGQQAIAEYFEMELKNLEEVVHGQASIITQTTRDSQLFYGLPSQFKVARYHSWVVEKESFSKDFLITSLDSEGNIMSMEHKELPIHAVQFHPESILTEFGKEMLSNWLKRV